MKIGDGESKIGDGRSEIGVPFVPRSRDQGRQGRLRIGCREWVVALGMAMVVAVGVSLSGCKPAPASADSTPEPEMKNGHPVVHVPPVVTRPFEDGYEAGFEYGKEHGTPRSPIPTDEEAAQVAREQAADHPDRTEHWEHGFAEGYADGVRKVVTGRR